MDSHKIARLLPEIFQRTLPPDLHNSEEPLAALLTLMEGLQQPIEEVLGTLEDHFDIYAAPEEWLYYLASWLGLEPLYVESSLRTDYEFMPGSGRLRLLTLAAIALANKRGTYQGLRQFLQVATGFEEFDVCEDPSQTFCIQIHYPRSAAAYRPLIERIVQMEKPAYVTYTLIEIAEPESTYTS